MRRRTISFLRPLLIAVALKTSFSWAHGMDKPGPHGGYIQMPGNFHTELLPREDGFTLFVLDASLRNASTAGATVTATVKRNSTSSEVSCNPQGSQFDCRLATGFKLVEDDKVFITVNRPDGRGISIYKYPFKRP